VIARQSQVSPTFFSWVVNAPEIALAACGVSDNESRVFRRVSQTLLEIGGATDAEITKCWLSSVSCDYVYGSVVARARLDAETSTVVWTDL
jgi:hypothetical protein